MRGDHIRVRRWVGPIPYWHHGIDMGDDKVAHFINDKDSDVSLLKGGGAKVMITSMSEFARGKKPQVVQYEKGTAYNVENTIKHVYSQLGKGGYNLLFNNCEHFATWCKTGKHKSNQVLKATQKLLGRNKEKDNILPGTTKRWPKEKMTGSTTSRTSDYSKPKIKESVIYRIDKFLL
jgi:hypothetical protein